MPRIRKRTSNRQALGDRYKIRQKIKESRKKKKKEAKNNVQWKSKHKKDPGIPNDFPFKDQLLAEVAEQRRIAAEEKERRKREKKGKNGSLLTDAQTEMDLDENVVASSGMKVSDVGGDAIASISAKLIDPERATFGGKVENVEMFVDEEEDEAPILMNHELLKAVLDKSDVLLQVLDVRDPLAFRSSYLENVVEGKKVLLVLNKIDTCPRESSSAWLSFLRREHPTFLFRSATAFLPAAPGSSNPIQATGSSKTSQRHRKDDALGSGAILTQLADWAKQKTDGTALNVAVVGLTNAGKSAFLNSLLRKDVLPVYTLSTASRNPTTTVLPQEVVMEVEGSSICFNDTPGLSWSGGSVDERLRVRDILLRSRGRIDRLKDPLPVVSDMVSRANAEDLMVMYGLPAFQSGDGVAFLSGVAKSNRLVKKRGDLDLDAASKIVLRDWNSGKLVRYTVPPSGEKSGSPQTVELGEMDKDILDRVRSRKEMRRSGGLVKLSASGVENREVDLEKPWFWIGKEEEGSSDEDEDEGGDKGESEGDDDEMMSAHEEENDDGDEGNPDEDEDDDDEQQEEELELPPTQKRKRAVSFGSGRPLTKKVAFASAARALSKDQEPRQQRPGQPGSKMKSILKKPRNGGRFR